MQPGVESLQPVHVAFVEFRGGGVARDRRRQQRAVLVLRHLSAGQLQRFPTAKAAVASNIAVTSPAVTKSPRLRG
jgi:hypothetical protein